MPWEAIHKHPIENRSEQTSPHIPLSLSFLTYSLTAPWGFWRLSSSAITEYVFEVKWNTSLQPFCCCSLCFKSSEPFHRSLCHHELLPRPTCLFHTCIIKSPPRQKIESRSQNKLNPANINLQQEQAVEVLYWDVWAGGSELNQRSKVKGFPTTTQSPILQLKHKLSVPTGIERLSLNSSSEKWIIELWNWISFSFPCSLFT